MEDSPEKLLEQYTKTHPQEVLLVRVEIEGEADEILIFKGFSSSVMRPTAYDPDVPVLPETAKILGIDRLRSPYIPDDPQYIQQNISWAAMLEILG